MSPDDAIVTLFGMFEFLRLSWETNEKILSMIILQGLYTNFKVTLNKKNLDTIAMNINYILISPDNASSY